MTTPILAKVNQVNKVLSSTCLYFEIQRERERERYTAEIIYIPESILIFRRTTERISLSARSANVQSPKMSILPICLSNRLGLLFYSVTERLPFRSTIRSLIV